MDKNTRRRSLLALMAVPLGIAATSAAAKSTKSKESDTAKRLDVLESRAQITDVLYAYAQANDRKDRELLASCFWPESTHHHGRFEGMSSDFIGYAWKIISNLKIATHHISNVRIEIDGDRAFTSCYYFAHHRRNVKDSTVEEDAFFEGRYLDFFERRNGVWKIIRRRGLSDWDSPVLPSSVLLADKPAAMRSGDAPDDDYYKMLAQFRAGK